MVISWPIGLLALFFVVAGSLHFLIPTFYVGIIPPWLPHPRGLVVISGICEILGGIGVLLPPMRRIAGVGLIALLIVVFPANIHMAVHARDVHAPWLAFAALRGW